MQIRFSILDIFVRVKGALRKFFINVLSKIFKIFDLRRFKDTTPLNKHDQMSFSSS